MATWKPTGYKLTNVGFDILSLVQQGTGMLVITSVVAGAGYTDPAQLKALTSVNQPKQNLTLTGKSISSLGSTIVVRLSNLGNTGAYTLNQIGIYATHPNYVGEQLYMIAQCEQGTADVIPAPEDNAFSTTFSLLLAHADVEQLSIAISEADVATKEELNQLSGSVNTRLDDLSDSVNTRLDTFDTQLQDTIQQLKSDMQDVIDEFHEEIDCGEFADEDGILFEMRRGPAAQLPALAVGEPAFTTDDRKFFIGSSSGNIEIAKSSDVAKKLDIPLLVTVTLLGGAANWSGNVQSVSAPGVIPGNTQVGTPLPEDEATYKDCEINLLYSSAANVASFSCETAPTTNLIVHLMLTGVKPV